MKTCLVCNSEYNYEMFGKRNDSKDGFRNTCKNCTKNKLVKITRSPELLVKCISCKEEKQYSFFAKGTNTCKNCRNENDRENRSMNREEYNKKNLVWRNKNKDAINAKRREREKLRRDSDPIYRLRHNLSTRLYLAVSKKIGKTSEIVGCSLEELMSHLETKFTEGMNWDNYGEWHVDHIRPCSSFNLEDPHEQMTCFHWSNLQPLWAKDNLSKGARLE